MNPEQLLAHFNRIAEAPGAIARLRQFILELGFSGRLTDPESPPFANVSHIAPNWSTKKIGQIATEITPGFACSKTHQMTDGHVHLRTHNIATDGHLNFDLLIRVDPRKIDTGKAGLRKGDVIFNNTNSQELVGKTCLVDQNYDYAFSNHLTRIRTGADVEPSFLVRYFTLLLRQGYFARLCNRWIGQAGINTASLREIEIPVPPLAEQRRIVAKVEELMGLCDRLEAAQGERERRRDALAAASLHRLNHPADAGHTPAFREHARFHLQHLPRLTTRPNQIPHLRQTILNLAVRGRLVPQDPKDEPAVEMLVGRQISPAETNVPWSLPNGWAWSTFQRIGEVMGGGTPSKANPDFWQGKIPWVSPKDMKVDFIADAADHVSEDAIANSSARLIPAGALLMVVRGMILAHSFPAALSTAPVAINQDMKAVVPFRPDVRRMLLLIAKGMKTEILRVVQRSTHGTCKLLTPDLLGMPIAIPPLAEQHRIVAKVDELMAVCDALEAQLGAAQTESRRLLESVLHHALHPTIP